MPKKKPTLGLIGIGLMGHPMAVNFLAAGYTLNVWNRTAEKCHSLVAAGAHFQATVGQLTESSDIILLCLSDTDAVKTIIRDNSGILAYGNHTKQLIDLSSIDPEVTVQLAETLQEKTGMSWVDAPVSGGVSGAQQGTLAIMAGGTPAAIETAQTILKPLYSRFTHMGETGCGQITKICNQMIVSCNVLVIAEMIALAQNAGVNAEKIPTALTGGFADSKPLQIVGPEMAQQSFEPVKWRVKTLLKDLRLANKLASLYNNAIPMSKLAETLLAQHGDRGYLEHDPSTLIKLYRDD
ncbi:MAG: NAD(P)-dependent oxidoreductase [Methylococcales bacterium]|nr:NAD(P)-dependent oxidoreductase [Methylococcaceae bacterium]HIL41697.1 NAD(P)-dependent oxidoreductase [Methylococcales bacterium]